MYLAGTISAVLLNVPNFTEQIILEKLVVAQVVKKSLTFTEPKDLISCSRARQWFRPESG
jgi:hypothetical protein